MFWVVTEISEPNCPVWLPGVTGCDAAPKDGRNKNCCIFLKEMFPQEVELHLFFTVNSLGATSPVQVNTQVFVAPHRLHLHSPHGNGVKL